jgi:uncharacterized protein (DUF1697 family)
LAALLGKTIDPARAAVVPSANDQICRAVARRECRRNRQAADDRPQGDLRKAGFSRIETYIASGNVVFDSDAAPGAVKSALEAKLNAYAGKPVGVALRTAGEMRAVLERNPFAKSPPNFTVAIFLDEAPPSDAIDRVVGAADEEMRLGSREIYVHYPGGMGRSKLRIPAAKSGTARNMNTVARLAAMALG